MSSPDWRTVSKDDPCPACGKGDWCRRASDDAILCHRVSEPPTGFEFVKATDSGTVFRPIGSRAAKSNRSPNVNGRIVDSQLRDFGPIVEDLRNRSAASLEEWAAALGVRVESLDRFGAFIVSSEDLRKHGFGFDGGARPDFALASPEYDGAGVVCGIAARTRDDRKGTAAGSKRGIARPLAPLDPTKPTYCGEGASDAWALDSLGLQAIARPNNSTRKHVEAWLAEYLRDFRGPLFFVLDRKGGEKSIPLVESLAVKLRRRIRYGYPPDEASDCREWLKARVAAGLDLLDDDARRAAGLEFADGIESEATTAQPPDDPEKWEPFPCECLPEPLRSFVVEQGNALGVDPAFVAVASLVVVASAIGNARGLHIKNDWREPSILWSMLVAESGSMKSPALRPAIEPLRAEERRLHTVYEAALEEHRAKSKTRAARGHETDSAPPPSDVPECERRIVNDATVEALAPILRASLRGLLLFADEGAAWFASFGEYKKGRSGDGARWCLLYDGEPQAIDRKGGDAPTIRIERGSVSVLAGIQPGILAARWSTEAADSGLLARCSFVMPPVRPAKWTEAEVSSQTRERYRSLVLHLARLPGESFDLELESKARERFIRFVNEHAEASQFLEGFDSARHSKAKGLAGRLALVVALIRKPDAEMVDEEDVKAGILLSRWFERETGRVVDLLKAGEEEREFRRLLDRIAANGGSIRVRDYQKNGPKRVRRSTEAARADLDRLVRRGLATWRKAETGGRPSEILDLSNLPPDGATRDESDRWSRGAGVAASDAGLSSLLSPVARDEVTEDNPRPEPPHGDVLDDPDEIRDFEGDP